MHLLENFVQIFEKFAPKMQRKYSFKIPKKISRKPPENRPENVFLEYRVAGTEITGNRGIAPNIGLYEANFPLPRNFVIWEGANPSIFGSVGAVLEFFCKSLYFSEKLVQILQCFEEFANKN